ncbi:MAG: Stp1/IreP family PP2C-type Ser/Thr phosphatase [Clostridia bacterium]|nr:Stp1/IreP family PP2C-type Ser/Thr phosphatase [Clostridia bacterium]
MLKIYCKSDIGKSRSSNQDAMFKKKLSDGSYLAVVCDGMGGANGGNIASDIASRIIGMLICERYKSDMSENELGTLMSDAIADASLAVYSHSLAHPELFGMGTTAVVAIIKKDGNAYISHVGDSRAYILKDNDAELITHDHSVVQNLIDNGRLTEEDAKNDPRRSIITRAVGVSDNVEADFCVCKLEYGDILLMCSDGLSNYYDIKENAEVILNFDEENRAQMLIDKANENGGGDNITVMMVCRIEED